MTYYSLIESSLGEILLLSDGDALSGLYLESDARKTGFPKVARFEKRLPLFLKAEEQLREYFKQERIEFALPLKITGSPFQLRVWQELAQIPYGRTLSYLSLASRLGNPAAARAVGAANARNKISLILPCHRVIGADASLVGYAGGIQAKKFLLELEAAFCRKAQWQTAPCLMK
ncbi:MAG: methylated-DNA--[protein]-cysteine S-methyltransferase [Candidatus Obscuribacterales bacterium]|nr:methylated-DNA--[protein]-cysteine S-methyltransferase [Candidatus Obscuribacterales bacterium]